jgi:hypothetical protein
MKTLKKIVAVVAFLVAGMVNANVNYTNGTEAEQTVTIQMHAHYSYYGFDTWDWYNTFTVTVAPGDTVVYDDYFTTWGDGGDYSEVYDVVGVQ